MVCTIVCADKNWGIGYKGELLAHIPEDMRFFRNKTVNNVLSRKTSHKVDFFFLADIIHKFRLLSSKQILCKYIILYKYIKNQQKHQKK